MCDLCFLSCGQNFAGRQGVSGDGVKIICQKIVDEADYIAKAIDGIGPVMNLTGSDDCHETMRTASSVHNVVL